MFSLLSIKNHLFSLQSICFPCRHSLPLPPGSSSVGWYFLAALLRGWNPSVIYRSLSISCPQKSDSLFLNVQFFRVHGTFLPSAAERLPDPTEQGGEWVCIWIRISFEQHAGLTWRSISPERFFLERIEISLIGDVYRLLQIGPVIPLLCPDVHYETDREQVENTRFRKTKYLLAISILQS